MLGGPIQIMKVNLTEFSWQRTLSYFAYLQTDMLVVANTASMSNFRICLIYNRFRLFPKFYLPANILFASNNIELSMKFTCFWPTITYHLPSPKYCVFSEKLIDITARIQFFSVIDVLCASSMPIVFLYIAHSEGPFWGLNMSKIINNCSLCSFALVQYITSR